MGPIPGSYWVSPGQLLAGEYPGARHDSDTRARLRALLMAGVTFFLDLTEPGEYGLKPYTPMLEAQAVALGTYVEHHRVPIQDRGTPSVEEMTRILDAVDAALGAGKTVYVHCYAGIGRTGTVIGCFLVRHGLTGQEALDEIARLRQDTPGAWMPSPETVTQRLLVRNWSDSR